MHFDLSAQLESVYRFCRARCFTSIEAEDMAQEILLTAWTHRTRINEAENPNAYLYGICRNVYKMSVHQTKREALHIFFVNPEEALESIPGNDDPAKDAQELAELMELRRRVMNLAREYRELIVAHYFEGKSIRMLSQESGMPEGTVKWRLMLARQCIKREWNDMEFSTRLKPVHIELYLSGTRPEHDITPELTTPTRRLLLWTLQTPLTIKETAECTGIPTMLVEEEITGMMALEAVHKLPDGKYAATFYIETLEYMDKRHELAAKYAPMVREKLLARFYELKDDLLSVGFLWGGRSFDELMPTLFMHLLHDGDIHCPGFHNFIPPLRPDGARYYFKCNEYNDYPIGIGISDWYGGIPGLEYRTCVMGNTSVMDKIGAHGNKVAALCKQLHDTGKLCDVNTELIATLIAAGVIKKADSSLELAVPWFTRKQFEAFLALAKAFVSSTQTELSALLDEMENLLKNFMPFHLQDQINLHALWGMFDLFVQVMHRIWPEDTYAAAGLLFVEE